MKIFNIKKSISKKISFAFILIMLVCIGTVIVFNNFFLEKIYIKNRANVLRRSYQVINTAIMSGYESNYSLDEMIGKSNSLIGPGANPYINNSFLARFIKGLQDKYNITLIICDENFNVYSLWRNPRIFERKLQMYLKNGLETSGPNAKILEKNNKFQIIQNGLASQNNFNTTLECFGYLDDNKTSILLSSPIMSITDPIQIFNGTILKLSLIILILGGLLISYISDKITLPIKKLAELSEKISKLDFKEKYIGNDDDEIGTLGKSMNEMSEQLEKTIIDLQNANTKLQEDLNQKEQLDIMRQEFVANVSHELKTPIALIQGYAEGLCEGMCNDEESKNYYCNVIIDEANKMNKIVRQLLNLSLMERGNEELDLVKINLFEIVSSIKNNCSVLINDKNINVEINIDSNEEIYSDEIKTEEIIKNYLTNAINHVDDNKIIKVFTNETNDNKIRLCIYNSGVKLSDENLKMIWEKFYKVDKAHTRAYGGSGLGLSIVKAIADKLNTTCGCYNVCENEEFKDGIIFYFDFHK